MQMNRDFVVKEIFITGAFDISFFQYVGLIDPMEVLFWLLSILWRVFNNQKKLGEVDTSPGNVNKQISRCYEKWFESIVLNLFWRYFIFQINSHPNIHGGGNRIYHIHFEPGVCLIESQRKICSNIHLFTG